MSDYALMAAVIAFATTVMGGYLALRYRKRIGPLAALTAGALVAVSILDIMPEAFRISNGENIGPEVVVLTAIIGFIVLFVLGSGSREHVQQFSLRSGIIKGIGIMAISEVVLHSFLEGVVIALGFEIDVSVGIILSIAVIGHDLSDGVSAMTVIMGLGQSGRSSKGMLVIDALAPAMGVVVTLMVGVPNGVIAIALPFIAGGFIYIGILDLLPQALVQSGRGLAFSLTGAGFASIALLSLLQ